MKIDFADLYLDIAKKKIADLINRKEFKGILAITRGGTWLHVGDQAAKVDTYGNVTWGEFSDT